MDDQEKPAPRQSASLFRRNGYPLLGRTKPSQAMGLDPLYGGEMGAIVPTQIRPHADTEYTDEDMYELADVPRWYTSVQLSFNQMVTHGLICGGAYGLYMGLSKCLMNWSLAVICVPLVPLMKWKEGPQIYPTPKQYWEYGKYRFLQHFGLKALWYRVTRRNLSTVMPMSKTVARRLARDREEDAKKWLGMQRTPFTYYERHHHEHPPPELRFDFDRPSLKARLAAHYIRLNRWFWNHPLKQEADGYRIIHKMGPNEGLPLAKRFGMTFDYIWRAYLPYTHVIQRLYMWKYATQHTFEAFKRGPWSFLVFGMSLWIYPKPFIWLGTNNAVAFGATMLLTYHTHLWFWGHRKLIKWPLPSRENLPRAILITAVYLFFAIPFFQYYEGGQAQSWDENVNNSRVNEEIRRKYAVERDPSDYSFSVNMKYLWDRFETERMAIKAKRAEDKEMLGSFMPAQTVFPEDGWKKEDAMIKINDGGTERWVKFPSQEFNDYILYRGEFANMAQYYDLEEREKVLREKMRIFEEAEMKEADLEYQARELAAEEGFGFVEPEND